MKNLRNEIIRTLVDSGDMSISALAQRLESTTPTVTKYISELIESGIVQNCGKSSASLGRKPCTYRINGKSSYFIGVAPRQHELRLSLMDIGGNMVREETKPENLENTPETLERICREVEDFIRDSQINTSRISEICFGLSGRVNTHTGESFSLFNFENHDKPLAEWLTERMGIRVIIDNDTRAMAYGELASANNDRYKNFLFVNAGWGIGLSIVTGGKIYYGMNGYSGELGHTSVYNNEIICHCGKKGCLETVASGWALCNQLKSRVEKGQSTILEEAVKRGAPINEKDIVQAALNDDSLCQELIDNAGAELGRQVANMINIFNPEAVIIGGSLMMAGESYIQSVKLAARRYTLRLLLKDVEIIPSRLAEKAGMIGCCLEAREDYLFNRILD